MFGLTLEVQISCPCEETVTDENPTGPLLASRQGRKCKPCPLRHRCLLEGGCNHQKGGEPRRALSLGLVEATLSSLYYLCLRRMLRIHPEEMDSKV